MNIVLRKIVASSLAIATLAGSAAVISTPASAQYYHRPYYYGHGYGYHYGAGGLAAGIIGGLAVGAIAGAALAPRPYYYGGYYGCGYHPQAIYNAYGYYVGTRAVPNC